MVANLWRSELAGSAGCQSDLCCSPAPSPIPAQRRGKQGPPKARPCFLPEALLTNITEGTPTPGSCRTVGREAEPLGSSLLLLEKLLRPLPFQVP